MRIEKIRGTAADNYDAPVLRTCRRDDALGLAGALRLVAPRHENPVDGSMLGGVERRHWTNNAGGACASALEKRPHVGQVLLGEISSDRGSHSRNDLFGREHTVEVVGHDGTASLRPGERVTQRVGNESTSTDNDQFSRSSRVRYDRSQAMDELPACRCACPLCGVCRRFPRVPGWKELRGQSPI